MLRSKHTLAALQRPAEERQGPGAAQRLHATRQIVHAVKRGRMLRAEHALAAFQRAAVERQGPRGVAKLPDAARQIVQSAEGGLMVRAEYPFFLRKYAAQLLCCFRKFPL